MLNNLFDYLNNSGRYFLSFWGPMKTDSKHQKDYIIDIFDRSTQTKGQYSIHHFVAIITEHFSSSSPLRAARQAGYCAGCVRVGHRLALLSFSSYGRGKMIARRIFFTWFADGDTYIQSTCFAQSSFFPPIPTPHLNNSGGEIRVGNWRRTTGVHRPSKGRPSGRII